jgi:hypothetical protein
MYQKSAKIKYLNKKKTFCSKVILFFLSDIRSTWCFLPLEQIMFYGKLVGIRFRGMSIQACATTQTQRQSSKIQLMYANNVCLHFFDSSMLFKGTGTNLGNSPSLILAETSYDRDKRWILRMENGDGKLCDRPRRSEVGTALLLLTSA